jgi:hypothetical protein
MASRFKAHGLHILVDNQHPGQIERREFAYIRHGTVTFLAALNIYDGTMGDCCLDANDHAHFLKALSRLVRCYPRAHRLHLILDNGPSHFAQATKAYVACHPRLRAFYTPPLLSFAQVTEQSIRWLLCRIGL